MLWQLVALHGYGRGTRGAGRCMEKAEAITARQMRQAEAGRGKLRHGVATSPRRPVAEPGGAGRQGSILVLVRMQWGGFGGPARLPAPLSCICIHGNLTLSHPKQSLPTGPDPWSPSCSQPARSRARSHFTAATCVTVSAHFPLGSTWPTIVMYTPAPCHAQGTLRVCMQCTLTIRADACAGSAHTFTCVCPRSNEHVQMFPCEHA